MTMQNEENKKVDSTGFLDWYKTNYGSDYDGQSNLVKSEAMSDKDYMLGRNMLENYRSQQSINTQQQNANQELIVQRDKAQQNASISLDKLMKYVGQQQQASGLNQGAGTSSAIAAGNNYQNTLGEIQENYQSSQNELDNYYQGQRDTANKDAFNTETDILNQYAQQEREDEQIAKQEQDALQATWSQQIQANIDTMAAGLDTNENGKYTQEEYNKLLNYIEENKDNLGENYYQLLKDYTDKNYGSNVMSEAELENYTKNYGSKTTEGKSLRSANVAKSSVSASIHPDHADNCALEYNGQTYRVEMDSEFNGSTSELKEIFDFMKKQYGRDTLQEGDTVLYDGELYVITTNGTLWTIKDRSHFWAWNWGTLNASDLKRNLKLEQANS